MLYSCITRKTLGLTMLSLLIAGCADSVEEENETNEEASADEVETGGQLDIGYSTQPNTLDPHISSESSNTIVTRNIFETLVVNDSDHNIQPMLAESFEQSDDGKTITFELREGVEFHNGKEMTAEDVVASMNNWLHHSSSGGAFGDALFEEINEYTVEIAMEEPSATALVAFARVHNYPAIMPAEIIEESDGENLSEFIGTGPFQFEEWAQDHYMHISKFDNYQPREEPTDGLAGKKEALVDNIYFHMVEDPSTRIAGIQTGEYDLVHSIPLDNAEQIDNDPEIDMLTELSGSMNLHFNKKEGIFTDVKAREAIELALDREEILHATYANEDFYSLNHNFMMEYQSSLWDSDIGKEEYLSESDLERAIELLEESGYDGEELTLMTSRDYEDQYNAAVVIQQQLEDMGLNINLEVYDWSTFLDYRDDENAWDLFTVNNTAVPEPSTTNYLTTDYAGWTDSPELEEMLTEFHQQPSLEDAQEYFDELQQWFVDYKPIVKIGESNNVHGVASHVHGVDFFRGFILWNVSKDEE